MKTYISFLESAGARVVPLIYHGNKAEELAKLPHLNGVFYAGGSAGHEYQMFAYEVFSQVQKNNQEGTFYPQWGTC